MPKRVAISSLNATTYDILNVIRQNASAEYQANIPTVTQAQDIPKVGEILYGYPALANQFLSALVNRIALVRINGATFNNQYADLKKGVIQFGETVEEVFVGIAKAREFSPEKGAAREFARTIPDVRTAFHAINYKVQYPVTIEQVDLRQAFLNESGVQDLIAKIVNQVYVAAEYDEFLLFKYLIIKAVAHGKMYPVAINASSWADQAAKYRGISNKLPFMDTKYNMEGVHTNTPKADQYIFMDAEYNAGFDVNVLAGAFNMEKADFMGRLKLIDDWTTFDNDRFSVIRAASTGLEEVTSAELAIMADVKAVLVDKEWFQVYDNLALMSEDYVAAGLYYNYFYNVWKSLSISPFSNAIVFVNSTASTTMPEDITVEVTEKDISEVATIMVLTPDFENAGLAGQNYQFVQSSHCVTNGIAVHKYGAIIFPPTKSDADYVFFTIGNTTYKSDNKVTTASAVGAELTFSKQS